MMIILIQKCVSVRGTGVPDRRCLDPVFKLLPVSKISFQDILRDQPKFSKYATRTIS